MKLRGLNNFAVTKANELQKKNRKVEYKTLTHNSNACLDKLEWFLLSQVCYHEQRLMSQFHFYNKQRYAQRFMSILKLISSLVYVPKVFGKPFMCNIINLRIPACVSVCMNVLCVSRQSFI